MDRFAQTLLESRIVFRQEHPDVDLQEMEEMEENEITYHAVEKDGVVTAIWEMRGRKHLRTIDPRSEEGRRILGSHTAEEAFDQPVAHAASQTVEQGGSAN